MAKIKCICFSRVSSSHQDLDAQRAAIMKAALKEYRANEIVEVMGKESAIKLSEEERRTLSELKEIVSENPTVETIFFFAVDRLARRVSVVMSVKEWADSRQINLVFLNPYPFSTWFKSTDGEMKKNDISDIYLMFLGFGAKMEAEIKNERAENAKKFMREKNQITGNIPYGYKSNKDKTVGINLDEAKVIRWVYDCYIHKGMSLTQIHDEGAENGYWTPLKLRTAAASKIRQFLTNPSYAGLPNPKNKHQMQFPPIVDVEDLEKAKAMLQANRNKAKSYTKNICLCKSIIKDDESNTIMIGDANHARYRAANSNTPWGLSMNICDTLIWRCAFQAKWQLASRQDKSQLESMRNDIAEVGNKIIVMKERLETEVIKKYDILEEMRFDGRISREKYNERYDSLQAEENVIRKRIEALEKREAELSVIFYNMNQNDIDVSVYNFREITDDKQRKEIVQETIKDMRVRRDGKRYIIKIWDIISEIPTEFLYIPHVGLKSNEVYEVLNRDGDMLDISDEIEIRFKRK